MENGSVGTFLRPTAQLRSYIRFILCNHDAPEIVLGSDEFGGVFPLVGQMVTLAHPEIEAKYGQKFWVVDVSTKFYFNGSAPDIEVRVQDYGYVGNKAGEVRVIPKSDFVTEIAGFRDVKDREDVED